ncbi:MAG: DUF1232 domain-containing protein [Chloroflexota bacterium]
MSDRMGTFNELMVRGRLVWRLLNDNRVPSWLKIGIPLLVAIYLISPVDLIPDFILGLGQIDDLGVVLIGMSLIIRFAPNHVVDEHRIALGYDVDTSAGTGSNNGQKTRRMSPDDETIEGEYKVVRPRD